MSQHKKCEHNKRKSRCKECGGSELCEHNNQKYQCKKCGGSQICEHNIQKSGCKRCKGHIQLDTHHIKEQKDANESGFFTDTYFHKNSKFNLVTLCKPCHKKIDTGELIINGYKQSSSGVFLDYIQK